MVGMVRFQFLSLIWLLASLGSTSSADFTDVGGSGDLTDVLIPPKKLSTTSCDYWTDSFLNGYEIFGENVYMSDVVECLRDMKHPTITEFADKEKEDYEINIRAETFRCDKGGKDDVYLIPGISKLTITSRHLVADGCHLDLSQPKRQAKPASVRDGKDGTTYGMAGEKGENGEKGYDGRSSKVVISFFISAGLMKITANGGDGGRGGDGANGGDGFVGKPGEGAYKAFCRKTYGSDGSPGADGGDGGTGGDGGDGGNAAEIIFLTPGKDLGDIKFQLKGAPGKIGDAGNGGQPGKGGAGGRAGYDYDAKLVHNPRGMPCKYTKKSRKPGADGQRGSTENGVGGSEGSALAHRLEDNIVIDGDVSELTLLRADEFYRKNLKSKAIELYDTVKQYSEDEPSRNYAISMKSAIDAGLNFYGFRENVVFAEDLTNIRNMLNYMMQVAKNENDRIDRRLYRTDLKKRTSTNYQSLMDAFVINNKGVASEIESLIELQMYQRNKVVKGISSLEDKMDLQRSKVAEKAKSAQIRAAINFVFDVMKAAMVLKGGVSKDKIPQYLQTAYDMGKKVAACGPNFQATALKRLLDNALNFEPFKDEMENLKDLRMSDIPASISTELNKATLSSNIEQLKADVHCLVKAEKPGRQLEAALNVYLDFGMARYSFIGRVYDIDLKLKQYDLKLQSLTMRNDAIKKAKEIGEKVNQPISRRRVAFTQHLVDTFRETERDLLRLIYVYTESLKFATLWDFSKYLTVYKPRKSTENDIFDSYLPLEDLRKKIEKCSASFSKIISTNSRPQNKQRWSLQMTEKTDPVIIGLLREYGSSTFTLQASSICENECSNYRLTAVYAELVLEDNAGIPDGRVVVLLQHLGENKFYVGNRTEEPIILKQNKILDVYMSSDVRNPLIKTCEKQMCEIHSFLNENKLSTLCSTAKKDRLVKRFVMADAVYRDPCRSPFAQYAIHIPMGSTEESKTQANSNKLDTNKIKAVNILFEVTFWTEYPKDIGVCSLAKEKSE